jgi:hypothetical protein
MAEYAHAEVLVTTQWVADHAKDPHIRVVEVDVDTGLMSKVTSPTPSPGTGRPSSRIRWSGT